MKRPRQQPAPPPKKSVLDRLVTATLTTTKHCILWILLVFHLNAMLRCATVVRAFVWPRIPSQLMRRQQQQQQRVLQAQSFRVLLDVALLRPPPPPSASSPISPPATITASFPRQSLRLYATKRKATHYPSTRTSDRPYHLVIVESPSKCQTIAKILQSYVDEHNLPYDYYVTSCMGHVRNLLKKQKKTTTSSSSSSRAAKTATNKTSSNFPYTVVGIDLDNNYQPTYEIIAGKQGVVSELRSLTSQADQILLATDPDREGEAMAWHLTQVLGDLVKNDDHNDSSKFQRISFTEITPTAILNAVQHPVGLNPNLIQAQETRRILDRLAGFTVSPVLWRKIAPGLSAGRVQSVGMALTVQRELERLRFESTQYSSIQGIFNAATDSSDRPQNVTANLITVNGTTVASSGKDFASQGQTLRPESQHKLLLTANDCPALLQTLLAIPEWRVVSVTSRPRHQSPPQPYRTSTLQQEAVRHLGMSVQQTMRTAQQLYEQGLISYMRTDATYLSDDAESAVAKAVTQQFQGDAYVKSGQASKHKKQKDSKFAQEAHEAIRPAVQSDGTFQEPELVYGASSLTEQAKALYQMIYKRTLASRMHPLVTNQTQIVIEGTNDGKTTTIEFRASGSVVISPGYTMAYGKNLEDDDNDENETSELPALYEGQVLSIAEVLPQNHQTQPPPRYSEASFVKELEALGVGRPSTYAGIVQLLRDRAYVGSPATKTGAPAKRASQKTVAGPAISAVRAAGGEEFTGGGARGPMVPSLSALVVCSLLEKHCPTYVDPDFTARMEERLDSIANSNYDAPGDEQRVAYLNEFYAGEKGLAAQIKYIDDNVPASEARRASLPALETHENDAKDIGLFVGPWGPYVQQLSADNNKSDDKPPTTSLPAGMAADMSNINPSILKALLSSKEGGGVLLGEHPEDGRSIRLKTGRFGAYLQWGDDGEEGTTTHSLPRHKAVMRSFDDFEDIDGDDSGSSSGISLSNMLGVTFEEAVGYVGLPRTVCTLEDHPITAAIGPYGPYLKYNNKFMSLNEKDGDVLTVDAETATRLVQDNIVNGKAKSSRGVLAELGEKAGSMVTVKSGRFGNYLNWERVNAKLPAEYADNPSEMPLEEAWALIQEKAGSTSSFSARGKKKSTKSVKNRSSPKRPKSAYLYFCAAKRPEVSETVKSLGEISKELARLWSETEDKSEYEALAAKDKERYRLETEEHSLRNGTKSPTTRKKNGSKPARTTTTTTTTTTRAPSAYMLFCKEYRPTMVDENGSKLPFGETTKRLAALWKECDDATRQKFQELAQQEKEKLLAGSATANSHKAQVVS